jgi:hypothetical protein
MPRILLLIQLVGIVVVFVGCSTPHTSNSEPAAVVPRLGPSFPPAEAHTFAGKNYSVRWLQQRSEFEIHHEGPPRVVKISFRIATFKVARRVWLEHDGAALPAREVGPKNFWEGGDVLIDNTVTLHAGENRFAIVTDGNSVDVTPGRPVFLLLIDGIEVTSASKP